MAVLEASSLNRTRRFRRSALTLLALVLPLAVAAGAAGARHLLYRGEVMPGVRVLGEELSGLRAGEAGIEVRRMAAARLREPVRLDVGIGVVPAQLFTLDRQATVAAALERGRESWTARARSMLSPVTDPVEVEPVLVARPSAQKRLDGLLRRFAEPPASAGVVVRGTEPVLKPSRPGTTPDLAALVAALERRVVHGGAAPVRVAFRPAAPAVGDAAARAAAEEARLVVSAPVALTFDGESIGGLEPGRLARLLTFRERGGRLLVLLDRERLARVLDPAIAPFESRAVNARFQVDGRRAWVVPSQPGRALDAERAVVAVTTAAHRRGERAAALSLSEVDADLTTAEATALGIRERISSFTTEMGPSSANRIHNVHLLADYVDGTIVRPGETFSFNERVGPRTAERGFLEGQMIVGSLLVPSVGGGVCQTATTLFNNAFELGLPILERHNHSFYISHYPLGRDATVSWGGPDFRFANDMEQAILIKASYTDDTLTFTFYGTDEGRKVQASEGPKRNWKEPAVTYALDPAAPPGSMRVERGSHQSGFDVTVHRTVTKGGRVLRKDAFTSRYIPVGDTAIYGPGRDVPEPYFVIPST